MRIYVLGCRGSDIHPYTATTLECYRLVLRIYERDFNYFLEDFLLLAYSLRVFI